MTMASQETTARSLKINVFDQEYGLQWLGRNSSSSYEHTSNETISLCIMLIAAMKDVVHTPHCFS